MPSTPSGIETLVRDVQPKKALSLIFVTPSGMVKLVSPESLKTPLLMFVTPEGKLSVVSALQPANAKSSMVTIVSGRAMSASCQQLSKAPVPMRVTPPGISMPVRLVQL